MTGNIVVLDHRDLGPNINMDSGINSSHTIRTRKEITVFLERLERIFSFRKMPLRLFEEEVKTLIRTEHNSQVQRTFDIWVDDIFYVRFGVRVLPAVTYIHIENITYYSSEEVAYVFDMNGVCLPYNNGSSLSYRNIFVKHKSGLLSYNKQHLIAEIEDLLLDYTDWGTYDG